LLNNEGLELCDIPDLSQIPLPAECVVAKDKVANVRN